jgi:pimeloyl-ACP methyl ester carboxylesterase
MTIHTDLLGAQTRYVGTNPDYRTRIIEYGEGDVLFLLHGGGGHAEAYSRNMATLGQHYRVIAPDFIWHGFSAAPAYREGNWLRQFTEQILHVMDAEGIARASFEGESLGGWIAVDLALNFPERVDKIILNTAWGMQFDPTKVAYSTSDKQALLKRSTDALLNPSEETIRGRMEWLMLSPERATQEIIDVRRAIYMRPSVQQSLLEYYRNIFDPRTDAWEFSEDDLRKIPVDTLVLWSGHNPVQGTDAAQRATELIENASLYVIEDAGHWPQWEQPREHDEVVTNFLLAQTSRVGDTHS